MNFERVVAVCARLVKNHHNKPRWVSEPQWFTYFKLGMFFSLVGAVVIEKSSHQYNYCYEVGYYFA